MENTKQIKPPSEDNVFSRLNKQRILFDLSQNLFEIHMIF